MIVVAVPTPRPPPQREYGPELYDHDGNATDTYPGIGTFRRIHTNYDILRGSKWVFIAVVGLESHNEFEMVTKVSQFTRGEVAQVR
jgi:hypothetical protein